MASFTTIGKTSTAHLTSDDLVLLSNAVTTVKKSGLHPSIAHVVDEKLLDDLSTKLRRASMNTYMASIVGSHIIPKQEKTKVGGKCDPWKVAQVLMFCDPSKYSAHELNLLFPGLTIHECLYLVNMQVTPSDTNGKKWVAEMQKIHPGMDHWHTWDGYPIAKQKKGGPVTSWRETNYNPNEFKSLKPFNKHEPKWDSHEKKMIPAKNGYKKVSIAIDNNVVKTYEDINMERFTEIEDYANILRKHTNKHVAIYIG